MKGGFKPCVITANDLRLGDVVYLTASNIWARDHRLARLFTDEAEAQAALDHATAQTDRVVGAYLAAAIAGQNGPQPQHLREVMRGRGPSNYPHGKQEAQSDHVSTDRL